MGKWFKSPFSGMTDCLEISEAPDGVYLRNSREPHRGRLHFKRRDWEALLVAIGLGEHRLLAPGNRTVHLTTCMTIKFDDNGVHLHNPCILDGARLHVTRTEWAVFVKGVKQNQWRPQAG